jgi:hypothetical protein
MNWFQRIGRLAGILAVTNLIFPVTLLQAAPPYSAEHSTGSRKPQIRDVELRSDGQLVGQIAKVNGQPAAAQQLIAIQDGRHLGVVTSDQLGRFRITGLHGGLFQIVSGGRITLCRGWADGTAPPVASRELLLVQPGVIERGQRPFRDLIFADPVMVGLVIAAAVAVPIAVSNSRSESPPGS